MSYCRFSSDDFQCNAYCYEDVNGGWTTHVASRKLVAPPPTVPNFFTVQLDVYFAAHQKQMDWLKTDAQYEDIGLEHDGETFNDPTPMEAAKRLEHLQQLGYHVPQYAIDMLKEESE